MGFFQYTLLSAIYNPSVLANYLTLFSTVEERHLQPIQRYEEGEGEADVGLRSRGFGGEHKRCLHRTSCVVCLPLRLQIHPWKRTRSVSHRSIPTPMLLKTTTTPASGANSRGMFSNLLTGPVFAFCSEPKISNLLEMRRPLSFSFSTRWSDRMFVQAIQPLTRYELYLGRVLPTWPILLVPVHVPEGFNLQGVRWACRSMCLRSSGTRR